MNEQPQSEHVEANEPASPTRREFMIRSGLVSTALMATGPSALAAANATKKIARPASGADIVTMEATTLSTAIRTKVVSCREVMQAYLTQIDRLNPKVNAIVSLQDREGLLKQADERDQQLAKGTYLGWMHGFPQAPKDLANTAGILTTQGSPILKNNIPKVDAIIVERVKRNGAILTRV